jgi:hypothetical protein
MDMRSKAIGRFLSILGAVVVSVAPASVYASDLDLTTAGATQTATANIGGSFTVQQISPQSTGTGVIDSFLRVQSNGTSEQGYNTSLGTPMDDKGGGFTRAITLAEVPLVDRNGTPAISDDYYQFLLDINQNKSGTDNLLSLNQIQIFTATADQLASANADATATTAATVTLNQAGATERFRMSSTTAPFTRILLDYSLNPGSGAGDMFLYVAKSAFGAAALTDNVILFTQFGIPNGDTSFGTGTNDGIEEWAVLKPTIQQCQTCNLEETPEPASLMLLGSGLAFAAARFRRKTVRQA